MDIVGNFKFVLLLQILEFPEAPKNQVQLYPNPTEEENSNCGCVPNKFNFNNLIIYRNFTKKIPLVL